MTINYRSPFNSEVLISRSSKHTKDIFGQKMKPDDNWSCIAHLNAEDLLKSAVIEEKNFKHSPIRAKILCQQEGLITVVICYSFHKISLKSDFILFFHHLIHIAAGAYNPLGTQFLWQQEHLVILVICCKFKKISLKSNSIHFLKWFYTCV